MMPIADSNQTQQPNADERDVGSRLRIKLREVLCKDKMKLIKRRDALVVLLRKALNDIGVFYRTAEGMPLFFRYRDRKLCEVDRGADTPFGQLVTYLADIGVRNLHLADCVDRIQAKVLQEAQVVDIHGLAYNSPNVEAIALNDFGGGMWYRERGGKWEWRPNGSGGILFWTPGEYVETWKPEFSPSPDAQDEDHLTWFLSHPHFAEDVLTAQDQQLLSRALLLSVFFPRRNRMRAVPVHLGLSNQQQHDTGKTMWGKMLGMFFVGKKFEPTPIESSDKGKEALHLSLMGQPYVLLDNVDTDIPWLNDFLCTYATGHRPSRRKLYTNATLVHYEPRGRLCLTSRKAKFTRVDTASRIIPFRFRPITDQERKTEWELLNPVLDRRGQVWAGVLTAIARVQDVFPLWKSPQPTLRLADFEQFGWFTAAAYGEQDKWQPAIDRLKLAQSGFALEDEAFIPVLEELLKKGEIAEQPTSDLYKQVEGKAKQLGLAAEIPKTASAFTQTVNSLQSVLESILDVKVETRTLHGQTLIKMVKGESWGD